MDAALVDLVPAGGGETAGAGEDDDFTIEDTGGNEEDDKFDMIVGLLEDIMMGAWLPRSAAALWCLLRGLSPRAGVCSEGLAYLPAVATPESQTRVMFPLPRRADDGFIALQDQFCNRHCGVFENTDENKLEYTRIFESYTKMIESFVMESLTAQLPGFSMEEFLGMLQAREGQLDGDVFELLYSLGDFAVFKDLILSYKPENQLDFSAGLTVTPVSGADDAMVVSPARAGGAVGVGGGASLA
jgi:hypothetical protein